MKAFISQLSLVACLASMVLAGHTVGNAQGSPRPSLTGVAPAVTRATPAPPPLSPTHFRVGEKLSYSVSFGKFTNAAYAEMSVVSRGILGGRDAIELRSKLKTLDLVNATFFQWDETRTVFVAPDTGLPLFVTKRLNNGMTPTETSENYIQSGAAAFDMLSLIYKSREAGGNGSFPLFENQRIYNVTMQGSKSEHVRTEAGEFDTVVSVVQSDYLAAKGVKECRIYFSSDNDHMPVLFRMKTSRGEFNASLIAVQQPTQPAAVLPASGPFKTPPGNPAGIKSKPTPTPYIENQPLAPELGFDLGEVLEYNVSSGGAPVAAIALEAKERRQYQNEDSLVLAATVTRVEPGTKAFVPGDYIHAYVDPETLTPRMIEVRFSGESSWLNETVGFDKRTGAYSVNGAAPAEAPMGTHTVLSLIYAMRSFNLKPSKDPSNPVNDTRVSVFWATQPYVFTLRPAPTETIVINGEKTEAQPIKVTTGNDLLDRASLRVWLSASGRVPLRFGFGTFQADLINIKKSL